MGGGVEGGSLTAFLPDETFQDSNINVLLNDRWN